MLKGAQFKEKNWDGWARTRFEPSRPSKQFPEVPCYGYMRIVKKGRSAWMCYCRPRHDWLVRTLVMLGVNVKCFASGSQVIPRRKCEEIARALMRLKKENPHYSEDKLLLDNDIQFYQHCGGVRIHDWGDPV